MWKSSSFKIFSKTLKDLKPEASQKVTEAFEAANAAFDKASEAVDKASEAVDSAFQGFSTEDWANEGNMQTEHMNIKVNEKSVTINGDVTEINLNGKKVYPA